MPPKVHISDMLQDIVSVSQELGRTPTTVEYEQHGRYSTITIRKNFGSWKAFLGTANLPLSPKHRNVWSDAELQDELKHVENLVGHQPNWTEIKKYSKISPDTFGRRIERSTYIKPVVPELSPDWSVSNISPEIGGWISGLVTGEGSFIIRNSTLGFCVGLRADDTCIVEFIAKTLDIPFSNIRTNSNQKRRNRGEKAGDEVRFSVHNRMLLANRIVPFFDLFTLRGRKLLDYKIFREAVIFLYQKDCSGRFHSRFTQDEKIYLKSLSDQLKSLRKDPSSEY